MSAGLYNITIDQNSDFSRTFQVKLDDIVTDLTGYSFAASLKQHYTQANAVDFATAIIDDINGLFQISLDDSVTSTMAPGAWSYDVVMISPTAVRTRLLQGQAFISAGITQ